MGRKSLKTKLQKQIKKDEDEECKIVRRSNTTYQLHDDKFEIKTFESVQYASAYFLRLEKLRPSLKKAASSKWEGCNIANEIVNVKQKVRCKIIHSS